MKIEKSARDADAYRNLPCLLKPAPPRDAQARRAAGAVVDVSAVEPVAPPPPSAGFNPYFELPPDADGPASARTKGQRR